MRVLGPLFGICAMCVASAGLAGEHAVNYQLLENEGQVVTASAGASRAVVSFEAVDGELILTALLSNGAQREELRGRIGLSDGQGHAFIVNSTDGLSRDRFMFQRSGSTILVTSTSLGLRQAELALE